MWKCALILCVPFYFAANGHHDVHRRADRAGRRHRGVNDGGALRFEPQPFSKKLELNSSGRIHCKVGGGAAPSVEWFLNQHDPLPEGVTSVNGTLLVAAATRAHRGTYTCRASEGDKTIEANVYLDVVVSPKVIEPAIDAEVRVTPGQDVWLHCQATGEPAPTTHWDRDLAAIGAGHSDAKAVTNESRLSVLSNGTLRIAAARATDAGRYGCTAGSAAGLDRRELTLLVEESSPPAGRTALAVSVAVAGAYIASAAALMCYCRRRRRRRRDRAEKLELELAEGTEKLVENGDKPRVTNGLGRLLEKDSGPDNSESCVSKSSRKSAHQHLTVPWSLITDAITLGRGEFGEVQLAKVDIAQLRRLRSEPRTDAEAQSQSQAQLRPVLVKILTAKDEPTLLEFRRQLELFTRVRHDHVARLLGLCDAPHGMLLEHADWGDLKQFLIATRSPAEHAAAAAAAAGPAREPPAPGGRAPALPAPLRAGLARQLAAAGRAVAAARATHRDIAARNCCITSRLQLRLSLPALSRGPRAHEYAKHRGQVMPLRWLPAEVILEGDYSTKSDVYMFAATVWEIYTKAELPFAKLNDNSVLERVRAGTLTWSIPPDMPKALADLLQKCWSQSPTDRPLFDAIYEDLDAIVKSESKSDADTDCQPQEKDEEEIKKEDEQVV